MSSVRSHKLDGDWLAQERVLQGYLLSWILVVMDMSRMATVLLTRLACCVAGIQVARVGYKRFI